MSEHQARHGVEEVAKGDAMIWMVRPARIRPAQPGWRHGFEPRWDYERKVPGQGASPQSIGWLNRDSIAKFPANLPHGIVRRDCAQQRARRGWIHSPSHVLCRDQARPGHLDRGKTRAERGARRSVGVDN
jgi:hypothetical protein